MAFPSPAGPSFQQAQPFLDHQFDIFEWHPYFQSCVRYFLDHAQYASPVQALAAFVNIQLPFQRIPHPVLSSGSTSSPLGTPAPGLPGTPGRGASNLSLGGSPSMPRASQQPLTSVALLPYIRRLVATGCDNPAVLHGFFGDDWSAGIGWLHEQERRNYLFAAKSDNWLEVKVAYDMSDDQTIPFLRPLQNVSEKEIFGAESTWSEWLAMQDWMLGPWAPGASTGDTVVEPVVSVGRLPRAGRHRPGASSGDGRWVYGSVRTKRESPP